MCVHIGMLRDGDCGITLEPEEQMGSVTPTLPVTSAMFTESSTPTQPVNSTVFSQYFTPTTGPPGEIIMNWLFAKYG